MEKASDVIDTLVTNIRELCQCEFTSNQITLGGFQCFSDSIDSVTYRASIEGDASTSTEELLRHIETWINSNSADIVVQSVILRADSSCTVQISSLSEADCSLEASSSPVGAIVGGIVAAVIFMFVLVIVIIVIMVCLRRRQARYKPTFPRG